MLFFKLTSIEVFNCFSSAICCLDDFLDSANRGSLALLAFRSRFGGVAYGMGVMVCEAY